jgi:hypothetical protein
MTLLAIALTGHGPLFLVSPTRNRIDDDHDVRDAIEARCHAQAESRTPERWGGGITSDHFGPPTFRAAI